MIINLSVFLFQIFQLTFSKRKGEARALKVTQSS
jgi:hypothetical protein